MKASRWGALALLVFSVATSACSGKDDDRLQTASADKVCDGAFRYAPGDLEKLAGGDKDYPDDDGDYLDTSVELVRKTQAEKAADSIGLASSGCDVSAPGHEVTVDTDYYHPDDLVDKITLQGGVSYNMGSYATAGYWNALLYFQCVSPELEDSREVPARIQISLSHRLRGEEETAARGRGLRDTNMKVAHSAALSVARELECENDGGLPEKPVLKRVK